MKKFLNDPVNFVDEMLEGIYRAHPELTFVDNDNSVAKSFYVGNVMGGQDNSGFTQSVQLENERSDLGLY